MKTVFRKTTQPLIPGYHENSALQLIIVSGVAFIIFHFVRIVMLIVGWEKARVFNALYPNTGLGDFGAFKDKPWTILSYGWLHHGFFEWFTNMIWLYCFGAVLQHLAGYKQLIPLYIFSLIFSGALYISADTLGNGFLDASGHYLLGAQAGITALGIAALTFSPRHKVSISEQFTIPLLLIVGIYLALNLIVFIPDQLGYLTLSSGGALIGFLYALLVKAGKRPGEWVYDLLDRMQRSVTPDEELHGSKSRKRMEILRHMYEPKKGISQQRIDDILDKINDAGYHSLSREEKDILLRAGKDQ